MLTYSECAGLNVHELFIKIRKAYGDRPAFIWRSGDQIIRVSYEEFVGDVFEAAYHLDKKDFSGKRVIISGRNRYEEILYMYAAAVIGAVAVMTNFDMQLKAFQEELHRLEPVAIICDDEDRELLLDFEQMPDIQHISLMNQVWTAIPDDLSVINDRGFLDKTIDLEAPALMLMSSGSSGHSKWVVLPQRVFRPRDKTPSGCEQIILPLYHVAAICFINDNLCHGGCTYLSDIQSGIRDMGYFHPQIVIGVPSYLRLMMKKASAGILDLSCFEMVGSVGAPQDPEAARFFEHRGISSPSFYGMTETMGFVTYEDTEFAKPGSVGKIGDWNEVRISDYGEILIRGDHIMSGYYGDEVENALTEDGWLKTGDLGYIDEDGYLFLTGRIGNVIILSNGENINPEIIEHEISKCKAVEEIVISGENDFLVAHIICRQPGDSEIKAEVKKYIARYNKEAALPWRIQKIYFQEIPFERNELGKIKRNQF